MNAEHTKIFLPNKDAVAFLIILFLNHFYCIALIGDKSIENFLGIIFSFMVIQFLALVGIITDRSQLNYSINSMHWIFVLIQFFYAPIAQIRNNKFPWNTSFSSEELLVTNYCIIGWCVVYLTTYLISKNHSNQWVIEKTRKQLENARLESAAQFNIMFIISTGIVLYSLLTMGKTLFSTREAYASQLYSSGGQIGFLIFNTTIRAFVLSTLSLFFWIKNDRKKKYAYMRILLLIYVVILYFPTNSGRMWVLVVYIGLAINYKYRMKYKFTLPVVIIIGIVFMASILSIFRFDSGGSFGQLIKESIKNFELSDRLSNGDFDCYTMLGRTIRYMRIYGITNGKQLLSSILFFVPRGLWPSKSIGSGALVIEAQGGIFTNVSSPMPAEALINFGYLGIVLFASSIAIVFKKMDRQACNFRSNNVLIKKNSFWWNLQYDYCALYGLTYLLMRGDMLSGVSNIVGFLLPIVFLTIFEKIKIKKTK